MKKLLVVSDSHGKTEALLEAAKREKPDLICHLGDYESDARVLTLNFNCSVHVVCGNCDFPPREASEKELLCEGVRIFMTHGHTYGVKNGLERLLTAALYRETDLLLFGHTHREICGSVEGMTVVNPGSVGYGKTYAVVRLSEGRAEAELKTL